jgi:hypothetical protein
MRYDPLLISRIHRYSLDRCVETGEPFFSIPVRNQMVDYEEYYRISEEELEQFLWDPKAALAFARRCGKRELDDRLVLQPGRDRGYWSSPFA